jgi:hypothetical protein
MKLRLRIEIRLVVCMNCDNLFEALVVVKGVTGVKIGLALDLTGNQSRHRLQVELARHREDLLHDATVFLFEHSRLQLLCTLHDLVAVF